MTTRYDPELGLVRRCPKCGEEWPFDSEFWHVKDGRLDKRWPARCIACCLDYFAERRRIRQGIIRANRVVPDPVEGRCNKPMAFGGRCGRLPGHAYKCRTTIAMQNDSQRHRVAA